MDRVPLHPTLQAQLDKASRYPAIQDTPLAVLRETAEARFSGRAPRIEVARIEMLEAIGPAGGIPIRLYHPAPGTVLPLLIFLHGGGYVMCDIETYDPLCRRLSALSGFAVAAVDYRLAPEHPFPAAPDDALAATLWLLREGPRLDVALDRIALVGDSAGGGLAAATAGALCKSGQTAIRAQALLYPLLDAPDPARLSYVENGKGFGLDREAMQWFWSLYTSTAKVDARATPLREPRLAGLPRTLVLTAGYDVLRDEGELYYTRLREAGVAADLHAFPDMTHGFLFGAGALERASEALEGVCRWLARAV